MQVWQNRCKSGKNRMQVASCERFVWQCLSKFGPKILNVWRRALILHIRPFSCSYKKSMYEKSGKIAHFSVSGEIRMGTVWQDRTKIWQNFS